MGILQPADLTPFAPDLEEVKAWEMIADVEALALRAAPCLAGTLGPDLKAAAKAVLRRAVLRWHETGNAGSRTQHQQTAGPFSQNESFERIGSKGLFWPSEIDELRALCDEGTGKAFMIDQVQPVSREWLADRPDLWLQWIHPTPDGAP